VPLALLGVPNWIFVPMALTLVLSMLLLGVMFVALKSTNLGKKPGED
jgi:hypothetical protein